MLEAAVLSPRDCRQSPAGEDTCPPAGMNLIPAIGQYLIRYAHRFGLKAPNVYRLGVSASVTSAFRVVGSSSDSFRNDVLACTPVAWAVMSCWPALM